MEQKTNIQKHSNEQGRLRLPHRAMAIGAAALTLAWGAYYQFYDKSGSVTSYGPEDAPFVEIDTHHNMISWNMHNETAEKYDEIDELAEKYDVDVVALQEVNAADAEGLHEHFPGWNIKFVLADAKAKVLKGGFGNVLMARQEQQNVTSTAIEGNSAFVAAPRLATGFVGDMWNRNFSFSQTKDATQEDRSAVSSTLQVQSGYELEDVRVITSHIAGNLEVHARQMDRLVKFVKKNREEGRPTIFCGDLNAERTEVVANFRELGFLVPETGGTLAGSEKVVDYCAYGGDGELELRRIEVLRAYKTDHYPLLASFEVPKEVNY